MKHLGPVPLNRVCERSYPRGAVERTVDTGSPGFRGGHHQNGICDPIRECRVGGSSPQQRRMARQAGEQHETS